MILSGKGYFKVKGMGEDFDGGSNLKPVGYRIRRDIHNVRDVEGKKKMKKLLMVVMCLLCFVLGCRGAQVPSGTWHYGHISGYHPIPGRVKVPVYMDVRFDKGEREAIIGAFGEWNRVFNGLVVFVKGGEFDGWAGGMEVYKKVILEHSGMILVRALSTDWQTNQMCGDALACSDLGGPTMLFISDRMGTRDKKTILMHEIGHLMGVGHFHFLSLMYPYYGGEQMDCPDRMTVMEAGLHYGINLDQLNYCSTSEFP